MDIADGRKVVRLFLLASPAMEEYVAAVERLCTEHNDEQQQARGAGADAGASAPLLVPVDWHWVLESLDLSAPHLLLARLPVTPGDLFLGILGTELGTRSTRSGLSAQQALNLAWEHWQRSTPGRHLLYRLSHPDLRVARHQRLEMDRLFGQGTGLDLSSRLQNPLNDRPSLRRRFADLAGFTEQLRSDLRTLLPRPAPVPVSHDAEQQPLCTLQLETFGPIHPETPSLLELGQSAAQRFDGHLQHPAETLVQLSFAGDHCGRRLVQAGLYMLAELLRPRQLNGRYSALPSVRLLADTADITPGLVHPPLNLQYRLNGLQHQPLLPGEFAISRGLLKLLPEALRTRFQRLDDAARHVQVWRFAAITPPPSPFRRLLGDLLRVLDNYDAVAPRPLASRAHQLLAPCYALLAELAETLQQAPARYRAAYHARWLVALAQRLDDAARAAGSAPPEAPPGLARLRELAGVATPAAQLSLSRDTVDAMQMLCRADDLGAAPLLERLLQEQRPELLGLLEGNATTPLQRQLAGRLAPLADRILVEELASGRAPGEIGKLFDALAGVLPGSELAAVAGLLRGGEPLPGDASPLHQRCELLVSTGIHGGEPALPRPEVLWPLVAEPRVPLPTLSAIGAQLSRGSATEVQKLFFDCGRARMDALTRELAGERQLQDVRGLLLGFLRQESFLEAGYFERLNQLLQAFLQRARQFNLPAEPYQRTLALLERAREQRGNPRTRLPAIQGLTLPVQQRLAGEWPYLPIFVNHPDTRVATVTRQHITAENVEQVLFPEINKTLLAQLLRDQSLFRRPVAVLRALNHPNCDTEFARRQFPLLLSNPAYRQEIQRLAGSSGANPAVRQLAQQLLAQRPFSSMG